MFSKEEIEEKAKFKALLTDLTLPMNKTTLSFKIWIGFLLLLLGVGAAMYVYQIINGLGVTDLRDIASWGIYIADFVFLIAVSLVGSLVTAVLKLTNIKWATPLTRIAEIIAVGAVIGALTIIVVDMGRPDRLWHIFVYGRLQSPIVWDIIVVNVYLVISLLLLYLPMVPDLALLRKVMIHKSKWQQKIYEVLSLGWQGTDDQFKILERSINVLIILIVPVALGIHTVTSWLFATTLRPGWDSTIFGPYFVAGAFMVGSAAVIVLMYILRVNYQYKKYITDYHFDMMAKLLVLTSLLYLYFNINEYMVPFFKMKEVDSALLNDLFTGAFAPLFWTVQVVGMIIPIILLVFKPFRKPKAVFVISAVVVIGAFLKRFLIVTPTLLHPFLPIQNYPAHYAHYTPTFPEAMIVVGSFAGVALIITLFIKLFPILPIWEIAHEKGISNRTIKNS